MSEKKLSKHKVFLEPTQYKKEELYKLYELIFDSSFTSTKKRSLLTSVLGYETWSWRVVGITEEAIKAIARNNFNKPSKVLARDHTLSRKDTYNRTFAEKMNFNDWWNWIWDNDKTILMTNQEHNLKHLRQPRKIYEIDPKLSFFVDGELVGWYQTKAREGEFVRQLCEKHKIDYKVVD